MAVFFLAVEAIKVKNLVVLKEHWKTANKIVNPTIEFVDDIPKDQNLFQRWNFEIFAVILYVIGLTALVLCERQFGPFAPQLEGFKSLVYLVPYYLFLPIFVGLVLYTGAVIFMERVTDAFEWIEDNTATGLVGILGFLFFLVQFMTRRVFDL